MNSALYNIMAGFAHFLTKTREFLTAYISNLLVMSCHEMFKYLDIMTVCAIRITVINLMDVNSEQKCVEFHDSVGDMIH